MIIFRSLFYHMDANIEDMDISFGDVNIHGGSDVIGK